ncbi:MAG: rubredoxin [Chloroflexota bacterium]|nr:rubredoxin [Chloroflexota bacterium]
MDLRCQDEYDICGYKYDPCKGDPENGLPPGTPLNEVSAGWMCPRCGADHDQSEETKANRYVLP